MLALIAILALSVLIVAGITIQYFSVASLGATILVAVLTLALGGFAFVLQRRIERLSRKLNEIAPEIIDNDAQTVGALASRSDLPSDSLLGEDLASVSKNDLGSQLQKIIERAYQKLQPRAVELCLFDEGSQQWTQALLIGTPQCKSTQAMLLDAKSDRELRLSNDPRLIVEQILFAGTRFGTLRVELHQDADRNSESQKLVKTLAVNAALYLVSARFTDVLLRMRRASEESVRAKTGFLANLSHELRGPLGIILNAVEIIRDGLCGEINDQQKETLKIIEHNGSHLLDLVNDVLDYAKVEAGKVKASPAILMLKPLLTDLTNVVRQQAMQKNQSLLLEPVEADLAIECDKRHFRQMVINLLTNAVKYTPNDGSITVNAKKITGNRIKISVTDTGIGIPEDQKERVFGAFERVETTYGMSQTGTGLGMPLTRKLAEVNGGKVDFDSKEGSGSTFWITLPRAEPVAEVEGETTPEDSNRSRGDGERVLVINREAAERDMLERYLLHQGFDVLTAEPGPRVMKAINSQDVQIVIIESDLDAISGEDLIQGVRNSPRGAKLPIILLSAKAFVFDIEDFLKKGADRCLSKPVEFAEIAKTVRELLNEHK